MLAMACTAAEADPFLAAPPPLARRSSSKVSIMTTRSASSAPLPLFPLAQMIEETLGSRSGYAGPGGACGSFCMPKIRVVDIGAMFLEEGEDAWSPLLHANLCESVVGFEPNEEECERLNTISAASSSSSACSFKYLPYAIGDGSTGQFRLCAAPMTSSMLEPNAALLRRFMQLEEVCTVVRRSDMKTRRLDDLQVELGGRVDFLKLDVQGYELAVLHGAAENVLKEALVVHTEVEFVEMYEKQPLFAEVDQFLRSKGFVFHRFASIHGRPMKPLHLLSNPLQPISQQMWADAVYIRDFWEMQDHSREELIRTAIILHEVYHSYDAVRHVLAKVDEGLAQRYLDTVLK